MTARSSCNISFNTSLDGVRIVRIPNPISNLGVTSALTAAGRIMQANPFDETIGDLEGIKGIEVVTVHLNRLF